MIFGRAEKNAYFCTRNPAKEHGALVQLVRIHACHAWGHGFESRTHRNFSLSQALHIKNVKCFFCMPGYGLCYRLFVYSRVMLGENIVETIQGDRKMKLASEDE